jgi:hypothetical protein
MTRILFVTVGTSAAENEEIAEHSPALKERLGDDDARTLIARLEDQPAQIAALQELLLAAHREFWEERDAYRKDSEHFRYTSAETISTFMALGSLQHGLDKVVLLVSDTVIGRVCGNINQALFGDYLFLPGDGSQEGAVIEEIKGLNPAPKKPEPFQKVYPQVRAILERYTAGNTSQLVFNISGGLKGLIPPITHLACTEYKGRSPEILYLHDTMRATVTLSPRQDGWKLDEEIRPNYYVTR